MHSTELLVENNVDVWRVFKNRGKSSAHLKLFVNNKVLHNVSLLFFVVVFKQLCNKDEKANFEGLHPSQVKRLSSKKN